MKKLSIILLLTMVVTFGLCIATEGAASNNLPTETTMGTNKNHNGNFFHNLPIISGNHTVICDISTIIQKTFQGISAPQILIIIGLILILVKLFKKRTKDNLSPPVITSVLSWSIPPALKTFQKLNPILYA